jgi:hypothetical protein
MREIRVIAIGTGLIRQHTLFPLLREQRGRKVLVWDLPTRLFHWLTVALMLAAYITWRID